MHFTKEKTPQPSKICQPFSTSWRSGKSTQAISSSQNLFVDASAAAKLSCVFKRWHWQRCKGVGASRGVLAFSIEQSRKLQVHGKGIHNFGKVPSPTSCFYNFQKRMSVHYMFSIAGVLAVAQLMPCIKWQWSFSTATSESQTLL